MAMRKMTFSVPEDLAAQLLRRVGSRDRSRFVSEIKDEVTETGILNEAYVPTLQNLSPGELQHAQNALDFATQLVTDWLAQYKSKDWVTHSNSGQPVTTEERQQRAKEIAKQLCDHQKWRTHGRSLKIRDLEGMRLKINDYTQQVHLKILDLLRKVPHIKLYDASRSSRLSDLRTPSPSRSPRGNKRRKRHSLNPGDPSGPRRNTN